MNDEQLKFLAAALALIISTGTAQFSIASFVNKVRDEYRTKLDVVQGKGWVRLSELYDLSWGYALGIGFNIVFFLVANVLQQRTAGKELDSFGRFLWWLYLINLIAWIVGMIVDYVRLYLTRNEKPKPTGISC